MPGLAHLYIGEEAVAVGVCEALRTDDYITSTHRGHGHCLAKGATPDLMFAELLGKEAGYCKGKGGSMHIADPGDRQPRRQRDRRRQRRHRHRRRLRVEVSEDTDRVAVCFFGEGALGQGLLYEEMNLAQLWKLPVIYVVREQRLQRVHALLGIDRRRCRRPAAGVRHRRRDGRRPGRARGLHGRARSTSSGRAAATARRSCSSRPTAITATTSATSPAPTTGRRRKSRSG